jgi:hypothetical protein
MHAVACIAAFHAKRLQLLKAIPSAEACRTIGTRNLGFQVSSCIQSHRQLCNYVLVCVDFQALPRGRSPAPGSCVQAEL